MLKKKLTFILVILFALSIKTYGQGNINIIYKVNEKIITNVDIEKELKYLISLNKNLKSLDDEKLLSISKESILREKIKIIELSKYFDLETLEIDIKKYLETFYQTLGIKNLDEFKEYLKFNDLTYDFIARKIKMEILWNQLIYDRHKNQIKINKEELEKKLKGMKIKNDEKTYFLSEIEFEKKNSQDFQEKIDAINKSINEIGFNNTANIFSISDSSKFGGKIGWIEERKLSPEIKKKLKNLSIGQNTNYIRAGSVFLILKIEDIKFEKKIIDREKELSKLV